MNNQLLHLLFFLPTLFLCGCLTFSSTSTKDFHADERFKEVTIAIQKDAEKTIELLIKNRQVTLADRLQEKLTKHFEKADSYVSQSADRVLQAINSDFWASRLDPTVEQRKRVLTFTSKINSSLVIFDETALIVKAFPTGQVLVSKAFAEGFISHSNEYDSVLIGIFIHELTHVRDGHALAEWASAYGRDALLRDNILNNAAKLTALIPFLSINHDIQYGQSFKGIAETIKLTEFSADLAAVTTLREQGLNWRQYTNFIQQSSQFAPKSSSRGFTDMQKRSACLQQFIEPQRYLVNYSDIDAIQFGSLDEGDKAIKLWNLTKLKEVLAAIDNPAELRKLAPNILKKSEEIENVSDEKLRATVSDILGPPSFTICALRSVFPAISLSDKELHLPSVDPALFMQYF